MVDPAILEARLREQVERTVPAMFGGRLVLAVSGGADSTAMAALLVTAGVVAPGRAVLAHFDHRLRGEAASLAEHQAVAALAERYAVSLAEGAWDEPARSEAAAREARYGFLRQVAEGAGAGAVVTGHTADDQAETVVMHAIRGCGIAGLSGMAWDAPWPLRTEASAPRLLRPLLGVSRDETRGYCVVRGLEFVDDPTNERTHLLRNRVRHQLLPALEEAAPGARAALLRLAAGARARSLRDETVAADAVVVDGAQARISRRMLRDQSPDVAAQAIRLAARSLLGDVREIGARHITAVRSAARTGSELCLPRGLTATIGYDAVVLSLGAPPTPTIDPSFERPLPYAGPVGAWSIDVVRCAAEHAKGERGAQLIVMAAGAVLRGRRPGDRIQPRGMRGHKKLQDYYTDRKVPRHERDAAPVIAAGRDIVWTPYGVAEQAEGGPAAAAYCVRAVRVATGDAGRAESSDALLAEGDMAVGAPVT